MKLTTYENPLTGKTDSITNLGGLWAKIFGVVILFFIVATGQNIAGKINKKVPGLDTEVHPLVVTPPSALGQVKQKRVL